MTNSSNNDAFVIPIDTNNEGSTASHNTVDTRPATNLLGKISQTIGTGENAKNSIIWMTITWSFYIASSITLLLFISLWIAYHNKNASEISELKKHMINMWSIFTPVITLALGYAFGKNETK